MVRKVSGMNEKACIGFSSHKLFTLNSDKSDIKMNIGK